MKKTLFTQWKYLTIIFIGSGILWACQTTPVNDRIFLSGKTENFKGDSMLLKNNFGEVVDTLKIQNGVFNDTLMLSNGYYYLTSGRTWIKLYLKEGMNLSLNLNPQNLVWEGKGANINNYMVSKANFTNALPIAQRSYAEYAQLQEADFLRQSDSIYKAYQKHLKSWESLDAEFVFLEENSIKINHHLRIAEYPIMKRMVDKSPTFQVSKNYPNPFEGIDTNNPKFMTTYRYKDLMSKYVESLVNSSEGFSETSDVFVLFLEKLAELNLDPLIKDRLGLENSKFGFTYAQDKQKYYETYMKFATIDAYKNEFQKRYDKLKTERGNPSPDFKFESIDGKEYTLNDFKGKYIYFDLWASWCTPCFTQIPNFKLLEKEFNEKINFVSIAWNDDKQRWKQTVLDKELTGFQLFSENKEHPFFKFYGVKSIPRFILLDKEGKIIESNARQPTDKNLREQLIQLK